MNWTLINQAIPKTAQDLEKILLENRQIDDQKGFFKPIHPSLIKLTDLDISADQVDKAIAILAKIKQQAGQIVIYGDYDADGICATAILWRVLYDLGNKVTPFIPDRKIHGYGLTNQAVLNIIEEQNPQLLITVDNGIVAHEPIALLKQKGIATIITDHHSPEASWPDADAIVHSSKACGASVAWIFAREVLAKTSSNYTETINQELDLAGLATIADQVPLLDANRSFASWGITELKRTKRLGLKELLAKADISAKNVDANTINFALAPRINAMGRLKHGLDALKLLCTHNQAQAEALGQELAKTNLDRQDITKDQLALAEDQLADQQDQKLLFVYSDQFHEGVIGLIAGRIMEKYHKPTIVISHNNQTGKASARSIAGIDIVDLIRLVREDLLAVGGHPMAAGFGLEMTKIDQVKTKLQATAMNLDQFLFEKTLKLDCVLPLSLVSSASFERISRFAPFGQKNKEPLFAFKDIRVVEAQTMGKDNEHLRLSVQDQQGIKVTVISWKMGQLASKLSPSQTISLAGLISQNAWKDRVSYQLIAKDILI